MELRRPTDRWLEAALRIHPGELRPTLFLFLQCLSLVGAFVVARAARDALLLSRLSPSALPSVYLLAAAAVGVAGAAWAQPGAGRPLARIMPATAFLFALALAAARIARPHAGPWLDLALYAGVEVMGALTLIQLWSHAAAAHDPRSARRLFPLIAAGGTLAGALAGLAVGSLARRIGVENLLWLAAMLLAAAGALGAAAGRPFRGVARRQPGRRLAARRPADRHLLMLSALTAATLVASTLVDYQFKAAAAAHHAGSAAGLASFLGLVSAASGGAALLLQIGLTSRLLSWLGVAGALALLPSALALGAGAVLLAGGLWPAVLARAADQSLRYTTADGAAQLLYLPLPAARRARAKALVEGVVRPAAIAAGGLFLLLAPRSWLTPRALGLATLLLCLAWLLLLPAVRRSHLAALREALRKGRAGVTPEAASREYAALLRAVLASADPGELAWALSLAPGVSEDLAPAIVPLLARPEPSLRVLACRALAGRADAEASLRPLLADPDASVRAAALAATHPPPPAERLGEALADPNPEVRTAALAALLRAPGAELHALAAGPIAALAGSADPREREEAARLLGPAADAAMTPLPTGLLSDADPAVRGAALASAGAARTAFLLPALVAALGRRDACRAAADALAARGAGCEEHLAPLLADSRGEPALRRRAAQVLGRIATPEAAGLLACHVGAEDEALRGAVAEALVRAVRLHPRVPLDRAQLLRVIRVELGLAWRALAAAEALALPPATGPARPGSAQDGARQLLGAALQERVDRAVDRALRLVRVLQPGAGLELARASLADGRHRAAAVELLDAMLDRPLRRLLLPLVEEGSREGRLRQAEELPVLAPRAWLGELLRDESPWVAAAAAHAAGALGETSAAPRVRELLSHSVPWVREAALAALERLLPPDEVARAARELTADPYAPARRRALALCQAAGGQEVPA